MRILYTALLLVASLAPVALRAQQDPMYTKYMFNSLAFNPAYAGTSDYLSAAAIVRDQWLSWDKGSGNGGAPMTYTASVHTPFQQRVGLGAFISQDQIGASAFTQLNLSYAYRLPLTESLQLSLGLQGGITHHNFDFSDLRFRDDPSIDDAFQGEAGSSWMPNAGAGAYLYSDRFYVGVSVPRLFESRLNGYNTNSACETCTVRGARNYRHLYLATGAAFPLGSDDFVLKPSVLVKSVGLLSDFATSSQSVSTVRTPTEFDVDVSMLFYQTLWVGTSFRSTFNYLFDGVSSHDSADIWAAFFLKNGMRIGMAYDYSLTDLQQYGNGSLELMIGYDMNFNVEKMATPRYF